MDRSGWGRCDPLLALEEEFEVPSYIDRDDTRGLSGWWNPTVVGGGMKVPEIGPGYLPPHIPLPLLDHYQKYMDTAQWRKLRRKIMKRAKGRCELCVANESEVYPIRKAQHVHHTTYERLFFERQFDLLAVCYTCHALLHPGNEALAENCASDVPWATPEELETIVTKDSV